MGKTNIGSFHARASLDATDFDAGSQRMAESLNTAAREIDNAWGLIDNRAAKSASASARVFEKSGLGPIMPQVQDYGNEKIQQAIDSNKSITYEVTRSGNSARNSASVFEAAFEEMERSDASFTSSFINKSSQRKASIYDESAIMEGHASSAHRAAMGVQSLNVGQAAGSKSASRFGLVMQQSGYQVQDFAVQVAGGQNALVALSQQGSQLLGIFGGWGAVAGAALSVGVLAYRMYDLADSSGIAKDSLAEIASAVKRVNEAITDSNYNKMTLAEKGINIKGDISQSKTQLTELRVSAAFTSDEKERVAILLKQEEVRLRLVSLADKELQNKKDIAKAARDAYDAQVALAKETEQRIDNEIAKSKAAYRARLNVTGSEAEKLRVDMQEATFLTNSKDPSKQAQGWSMVYSIEKEADAIRNQIDPMRVRRKEQERYNALVEAGLLTQGELTRYNAISADKIAQGLSSRVPQSLGMSQGVLSSGLLVGSASPKELIDINRQILEGIRKLVSMEAMASKGYN